MEAWKAYQEKAKAVLLSPVQIAFLNQDIEKKVGCLRFQPFLLSKEESNARWENIEVFLSKISSDLFLSNGHPAGSSLKESLMDNMKSGSFFQKRSFGIVIQSANQYTLPTELPFYDMSSIKLRYISKQDQKRWGVTQQQALFRHGLNENQENTLDIGLHMCIFGESRDRQWVYAGSYPGNFGWIKKSCIAFCALDQLNARARKTDFVVIQAAKALSYEDQRCRRLTHLGSLRQGMRLLYDKTLSTKNVIAAYVPDAVCGQYVKDRIIFMKRKDVHVGYLPYTKHNLLTLCYRMLGQRYGWGSENGHPDCSALMQQVHTCMGIRLPRNSRRQSLTGYKTEVSKLSVQEKSEILRQMPMGSLLYFPGHIGLYMGMRKTGQGTELPHMLHMFWAMRRWKDDEKIDVVLCVVAKAAITPLCGPGSGEDGPSGSFLERLTSIHVLHK